MKVRELAAKLALQDWESEILLTDGDYNYDIDRVYKSSEYNDLEVEECVIDLVKY